MTLQAIPVPPLGSYAGRELLMQAQAFTLDGKGLLVHLTYLDATFQQRHATWLFDLQTQSYVLNINATLGAALGDSSGDISLVETLLVNALNLDNHPAVAVLFTVPGRDGQRLALISNGQVLNVDVLSGLFPEGATTNIASFAMSDDGRFVAIQTTADLSTEAAILTGLIDENDAHDVYLLDRTTGLVTRISTVAGQSPLVPSLLTDIAISGGAVQVGFVSNAAFDNKDVNETSATSYGPGDAYLWSQSFDATGLKGSPTVTLISNTGTGASGGVPASADGQGPEYVGPLITPAGIYFNSTSPLLSTGDGNDSADAFVFASGRASSLVWNSKPELNAGATVVSTSERGWVTALLSASTSVAGQYGATKLLVTDTKSGALTLLPGSASAEGAVLSAVLSPNGSLVAFTDDASTPLAGVQVVSGGTLYVADTGFLDVKNRLALNVKHWKIGKGPMEGVVAMTVNGQAIKTAQDGTLTTQGFSDPDGTEDGLTLLRPTKPVTRESAGITLTDVLGALKVYLGKPLDASYDTPYKFIAADFQGDGDVDLSDVLGLLKYYLKKSEVSQPAWVFVDSAKTVTVAGKELPLSNHAGVALSKTDAAPPADISADLNADTPLQLIGVLRGDVDGSAILTA